MNPLSKAWLWRRQKFVRDRNCNEGLCLDIGCGEHPIFPSCIRVDVKKLGDVQASAECLPFKKGCFNMVFCLEVVEHLPHPTRFIRETHRVLVDNGKLIMTMPNNDSFFWRLIWFVWTNTVSIRSFFDKHRDNFQLWQLRRYFSVSKILRVNVFLHYIEAIKHG